MSWLKDYKYGIRAMSLVFYDCSSRLIDNAAITGPANDPKDLIADEKIPAIHPITTGACH